MENSSLPFPASAPNFSSFVYLWFYYPNLSKCDRTVLQLGVGDSDSDTVWWPQVTQDDKNTEEEETRFRRAPKHHPVPFLENVEGRDLVNP